MSDLLLISKSCGQRLLIKKGGKEMTYYVVNGVVFFRREDAMAYKIECK